MAATIGGTGRVLAGTELAQEPSVELSSSQGTAACAHLCVLGSSGVAQLGVTSTYLAQKKAHTCSLCVDLPTRQVTVRAARRAQHHRLNNLGALPNQPCSQQGLQWLFVL